MLSSCFLSLFLRQSSFHSKKKNWVCSIYLYTSCILLLPLQQSEHLSKLLTNLSAQALSLSIPVLLQYDCFFVFSLLRMSEYLGLKTFMLRLIWKKKKKKDNLWASLKKRAIVSHIWHVAGWVLSSQRNVVNEKHLSQFCSASHDENKKKRKEKKRNLQ